ncbi:MAG: hypothetical protein IIZ35_00025 [Clostridia bacterium]|nr:hypothetical protein [Clostridia bacterium]
MVTVSSETRHQTGDPTVELCGLSTDTKPTSGIAVNSLFLELNTGDFYYFTGETWAKVGGAE